MFGVENFLNKLEVKHLGMRLIDFILEKNELRVKDHYGAIRNKNCLFCDERESERNFSL